MNQPTSTATQFSAHLHWIIFVWPVLMVVIGAILNANHYAGYIGWLCIAVAGVLCVVNLLTYLTSALLIRRHSVIFQSGILIKNTFEIPFNKIESVDIRQNILGSCLNYGTIMITGTGGSRNALNYVAQPLTCRRLIEQAIPY